MGNCDLHKNDHWFSELFIHCTKLFGSGFPTDPCLKCAKLPTQYIFDSSGKKLKSWGFMKWNCTKLVAVFSKQRHVMQARCAWIPSWIPETHNSNLFERPKYSNSFIKTVLCFFGKVWFSDFADHMTINQVIGMLHGKHKPMESGRYHDIIDRGIIHHDVVYFAFTKMAESLNFRQKYTRLLPSIYTFFGLIFQKPLTCIRNNIVLHVYFNLECNENWQKAAYHASSDSDRVFGV